MKRVDDISTVPESERAMRRFAREKGLFIRLLQGRGEFQFLVVRPGRITEMTRWYRHRQDALAEARQILKGAIRLGVEWKRMEAARRMSERQESNDE